MVKVKELGFHKGKTWRKHHQQRGGTGSHGQANLYQYYLDPFPL